MSVGSIAEIQYNSSSITNQFVNNFYQGNYITTEIKEATSSQLTSGNFLGADANYGLYSSLKLNSFLGRNPYQLNWFIGAYHREHFDANVPQNLFKLIFEGNKQFAGKTVDAGGLSLNFLQYQQLQTGLFYNNGLGQAFAISISYLNGNRHLSYHVNQLDLYTSEIGDELNLNWNLNYQRSNLDSNQFAYPNGYGFSTDLMYLFNYSSNENDNNYVKLEINDLGFINWSQKSTTISTVDSINYTGYHIPDIQNIQDSILSVDSLINQYSSAKNGAYTTYLPTQVSMSLRQQHNKKLAMHLGIRYRVNANYKPYLYVEEHYMLKENIELGGRISYGGTADYPLELS